jgi:hypothetical protein
MPFNVCVRIQHTVLLDKFAALATSRQRKTALPQTQTSSAPHPTPAAAASAALTPTFAHHQQVHYLFVVNLQVPRQGGVEGFANLAGCQGETRASDATTSSTLWYPCKILTATDDRPHLSRL